MSTYVRLTNHAYVQLLTANGLQPGEVALYPRPTPLPTDIVGWVTTFARSTFFAAFSDNEANELMKEVQELCRPDAYWSVETPGRGMISTDSKSDGWEIMYVRLRGMARFQVYGQTAIV